MRRSEPRMAAACLLLAACGPEGCATPDDTEEELESFSCTLGTTTVDGSFATLGTGDPLELHLGFQGLLFVELRVQTEAETGSAFTGAVSVAPEGMQPSGSSELQVDLDGGTPARTSGPLQVFFEPGQLPSLTGRDAQAAVRLTSATHTCVAALDLVLVDEDPCIHTGDDPICPGDTGDTGMGR